MVFPELARILACYRFSGALVATAPLKTGHINTTYVVHTDSPGGRQRYVLQKINHHVFRNVPALMENVVRVTEHLRRKAATQRGGKVLSLVPANDGTPCVCDADGEWWRLYDFIEGAHTVDKVTSEAQAREAARAFGKFQSDLVDLEGGRLHETIVRFHHTPSRVGALKAAVADDLLRRVEGVRAEIDFALQREPDAHLLLNLLERGLLSERVAHNDTKINNVMLDNGTGRAVAVVDLDTVMPGLALYDFGDLVRASASSTAEGDPEPANMHVRLPLFRALVEGWLEAGAAPGALEREHLAFSGKLLAYETGVRFLTDYLQGDTYFKVHHPEHNLDRARTQFALVRSIEEQTDAMGDIVAAVGQRLGATA